MIAIDANLLLFAYNAEAREHERARAWLETTFSSVPLVGLPLVSVLAFVPRRPLQNVPGVATPKCTSPSVVKLSEDLFRPWLSPSGVGP